MAADPPDDDPFDGVEDLIEIAPPPVPAEPPPETRPFDDGLSAALPEPSVDRDRLVHELRRSLAATHPLEGEAILARIEATMLSRENPPPIAASCPNCRCALRVLARPRTRAVDSGERAGLLASTSKSLRETRSDRAALEALARELARVDVVMVPGGGAACPICNRYLRPP